MRGSYSRAASPRRMEDDFVERIRDLVQPAREVRRQEDRGRTHSSILIHL